MPQGSIHSPQELTSKPIRAQVSPRSGLVPPMNIGRPVGSAFGGYEPLVIDVIRIKGPAFGQVQGVGV